MATRMQKYFDDYEKYPSRSEKNKDLYKEIASSDIDRFELASNATVLTDAAKNVDIEKLKEILDTKYKETPIRKSIRIEEEEEVQVVDDTKEYDINVILEKAREEKEVNYEKDRLKKLRDTQFDILSNLKLDESKNEEEKVKPTDDLMELINTITAKELASKNKDLDPLDILTDLKGDGELTSPIEKEESIVNVLNEEDDKIDSSFFTTKTNFTESDFDDFNDLKAEVNSHKVMIIAVVIILMIIILVALIFGLNHFLDLGLF